MKATDAIRLVRRHLARPALVTATLGSVLLAGRAEAQATLDWASTNVVSGADQYGQVVALAADGSVYGADQVPGIPLTHESNFDARITKFASSGAIAWTKQWDHYGYDDSVTAMLVAPNDDLIVASTGRRVTPIGYVNGDLFVTRYSSAGAQLWQSLIQGFGNTALRIDDLVLLSNGAIVGVGSKHFSTLIARFSSAGVLEWQHSIGGGLGGNRLRQVAVFPGDELVACGNKGTSFNGALALFKYDASGALLWTSLLDETVAQQSVGMAMTTSAPGKALVVGYRFDANRDDLAAAQFDLATGALDWRVYRDTHGAQFESLDFATSTPDAVAWAAGRFRAPSGLLEGILLRFSPQGAVLSTTEWSAYNLPFATIKFLGAGNAGQVWITAVDTQVPRNCAVLQFDSVGALASATVLDLGGDELVMDGALSSGATGALVGATNSSGDYDLLAARFDLSDAPATYCTAKLNTLGCAALMSFTGRSSVGSTSGFAVVTSNVRNQKTGVLLYSIDGADATAFQGGYLCIGAPRRRTPVTNSGGAASGDDCSGAFSFDMNAFATGALGAAPAPELLVAGTAVHCQQWSRDPGAPSNSGLSGGLRFVTGP